MTRSSDHAGVREALAHFAAMSGGGVYTSGAGAYFSLSTHPSIGGIASLLAYPLDHVEGAVLLRLSCGTTPDRVSRGDPTAEVIVLGDEAAEYARGLAVYASILMTNGVSLEAGEPMRSPRYYARAMSETTRTGEADSETTESAET